MTSVRCCKISLKPPAACPNSSFSCAIKFVVCCPTWEFFPNVLFCCAIWCPASSSRPFKFSIEDLIRKYAPEPVVRVFNAVDGCTEFYARLIGTRLFGLEDTIDGETETEEEWTGRLLYLEKVFERTIAASETHFNKSMAQVKDQLTAEIVALEKRLYQHQKETDTAL